MLLFIFYSEMHKDKDLKMKKEKSGFALLMQWAGEDRKFIYASIFLALISSVCGIVPYLLFYRIIDRLVDGNMTSDQGCM